MAAKVKEETAVGARVGAEAALASTSAAFERALGAGDGRGGWQAASAAEGNVEPTLRSGAILSHMAGGRGVSASYFFGE